MGKVIDDKLLPWRRYVLVLFGLNWILSAITWLSFLSTLRSFPLWFGPVFLLAIILLLGFISYYASQVFLMQTTQYPNRITVAFLWVLIVLSVVCTFALHQFYPFRLDITEYWPRISPRYSMLKFNILLTVGSLLSPIALSIGYYLRYRRIALLGLLIVASIMLIPNDNCGNDFNRLWLGWIGASPLMFMPNSVVLIIGYCG
ncbi:hypothetical protein ACFL6U_24325 [Planctomycetota bacterium]